MRTLWACPAICRKQRLPPRAFCRGLVAGALVLLLGPLLLGVLLAHGPGGRRLRLVLGRGGLGGRGGGRGLCTRGARVGLGGVALEIARGRVARARVTLMCRGFRSIARFVCAVGGGGVIAWASARGGAGALLRGARAGALTSTARATVLVRWRAVGHVGALFRFGGGASEGASAAPAESEGASSSRPGSSPSPEVSSSGASPGEGAFPAGEEVPSEATTLEVSSASTSGASSPSGGEITSRTTAAAATRIPPVMATRAAIRPRLMPSPPGLG